MILNEEGARQLILCSSVISAITRANVVFFL